MNEPQLESFFRLVGPQQAVELFGIRLVGVSLESGKKLLFTIVFVTLVMMLERLSRRLMHLSHANWERERARFWMRQGIKLGFAAVLLLGVLSIWFEDPSRLTTAMGLITAGLAFALQRVIAAVAGYFIILRGKTFNVGDRISMGGVRGDVISLDFTQTTIMEMGQPPAVQGADPAMWLRSREYTGRIVTVSNARIFDEPVYNYSSDFPYIWEEMVLPIHYDADRQRAEQILLEAAEKHTVAISSLGAEALAELARRSFVRTAPTGARVYWRLTTDGLELTLRFLVEDHGIRAVKDAMTRDIVAALDEANIQVASASFEIAAAPPLKLTSANDAPAPTAVSR